MDNLGLRDVSASALELVLKCMAEFPHVPIHREPDEPAAIYVRPKRETGFVVGIESKGGRSTVLHGGWHHHFGNSLEATSCFLVGLTLAERLKVTSRGDYDYRWEAETNIQGTWGSIGSTVLVFFPYWQRRQSRYLQNDWIALDSLRAWIDQRFTECRVKQFHDGSA